MTISRRLARPLLSSIFITGGIDSYRDPASKVASAEPVIAALSRTSLPLPSSTETVVRFNGGAQVVSGIMLSVGKLPRLSAAVLIGSLVPTTWAGHRFWEVSDPATKSLQRIHFFKNLSIMGGLLIAAFDNEGSPSISYRARRKARAGRRQAAVARKQARKAVGRAKDAVS